MAQKFPIKIIGVAGELWLMAANPKHPGKVMTLRVDFRNRQRIEYIRRNLRLALPTDGYHFVCDECQLTNAAGKPEPVVTCAFCGYTTKNENYKAWQKFKRVILDAQEDDQGG